MSAPAPLFHPYTRLVKIWLEDKDFLVPEDNILLRALQYLAPEGISYGRFCWNEECQYCRVSCQIGEEPKRTAIACKLLVQEGMRVTEMAQEIRYCLRELALGRGDAKLQ